jgi:two-component system phosphate regulon sensor histidine kinase PhoR
MTSLEIGLLVLAVMLLGYFLGRVTAPDPPAPPPAPALAQPLPAKPQGPTPELLHIESLNGPVLILRGTRIDAANSAARSVLGDRVVGPDIRLTVRHPALLDAVDQVMAAGASDEREITGLGIGGLGGGNRSFRLRALADDDGRCIVLLDDVTQAKATERMRVDFVANASHELRTPLATLTGFIETLQGPAAEDAPARQRFLTIMAQEADRMRRLIDDLMSLSRIELDKFIRPNQPLALTGIAAEVARTLAMRLDADQRQLLIEEPAGLPNVMADRDQVLQVLHNLVSNALKYGRSGTPITVSLAPAGDMVRISVRDIGEGIAPEHLPRLTERFYRVDSQRSRTMGGTGLGLAIVKHIVERHRGRLEIDSHQGKGTVVSFSLPIAP